jgi:coenzyme F420-reducing hydrogenase delta subunit
MKVSGFTFIKNAIIYDYPIVEAIRSILPICDEVVVAVGKSDDETFELLNSIDKNKVRIIETVWDETQRKGGRVLALETDKAFQAIAADCDWAFYIQGDEAVHEKYLDPIHEGMKKYEEDKRVDGLLFKYLHFYGSYDYVGNSSKWYSHEIRVIRNDKSIYSFRDAQGFRKGNDEILKVKPIDACIYHYGWVKEPSAMQRKQENFNKYWHEDEWLEKNVVKADEFDYNSNVSRLSRFIESHPSVMEKRIQAKNWKFDYDISYNRTTPKEKIKAFLKSFLGIDTSYKNYKII